MTHNLAPEVAKGNTDFSPRKGLRRISYTCNNCKEHFHFDKLVQVTFSIWQVERAPSTGQLHIQGYVEFKEKVRYEWMKKHMCKHMHIEESRGTSEQNIKYCSKEETRAINYLHRYGEAKEMGKRNDFTEFIEEIQKDPYQNNINEKFPAMLARYGKWAEKTIEDAKFKKAAAELDNPVETNPNEFQKSILKIVSGPVDSRKIYITVDYEQGIGKSTITEYLVIKRGAVLLSGKHADYAYAWKGERIVIVDQGYAGDVPIAWDALEQIKNGMINSSKYESRTKVYQKPHVLVFMNQDIPPKLEKNNYGQGRWCVTYYGTPEL